MNYSHEFLWKVWRVNFVAAAAVIQLCMLVACRNDDADYEVNFVGRSGYVAPIDDSIAGGSLSKYLKKISENGRVGDFKPCAGNNIGWFQAVENGVAKKLYVVYRCEEGIAISRIHSDGASDNRLVMIDNMNLVKLALGHVDKVKVDGGMLGRDLSRMKPDAGKYLRPTALLNQPNKRKELGK